MILDEAKIIRLLDLCEQILAVKKALPPSPRGFDVSNEIAKQLKPILLEHHAPALRELARLLR